MTGLDHPTITDHPTVILNGEHVYQPTDLRNKPCLNEEIIEWCMENLRHDWYFNVLILSERPFQMEFLDETDAIHFKLRWVG